MEIRAVIIDAEVCSTRLTLLLNDMSDEIRIVGRFGTGAEARAFLTRDRVDLIVWKIIPDEVRMLQELRQLRCCGIGAPVIVLSRRMDPDLLEQLLALGAEDCILIPFDPDRLSHSIRLLLEKHRAVRACPVLNQNLLDHLLHHPLPESSGNRLLPKGLSQRTLSKLEQILKKESGADLTCEALAEISGFSVVTARKYLRYLMDTGQLTCTVDYETGGRPRVLYHIP